MYFIIWYTTYTDTYVVSETVGVEEEMEYVIKKIDNFVAIVMAVL